MTIGRAQERESGGRRSVVSDSAPNSKREYSVYVSTLTVNNAYTAR